MVAILPVARILPAAVVSSGVGILLIVLGGVLLFEGFRRFSRTKKNIRKTADKEELNAWQIEWKTTKGCFQHLLLIFLGELVLIIGSRILYISTIIG